MFYDLFSLTHFLSLLRKVFQALLCREEVRVCLDQLGAQLSAGGLVQHAEALDFISGTAHRII